MNRLVEDLCTMHVIWITFTLLLWHCIEVKGLNMLKYDETRLRVTFDLITVSPESGHVFVAGKNVLYHFDAHLNEEDHLLTGPRVDGPRCSPLPNAPLCQESSLVANDASVLEIYPDGRYLLFCGTVKQGLCTLYSQESFNRFQSLDATNMVNYLGSRKGAVAFFGRGFSVGDRNATALYTGINYDDRPMQYFPEALSARRLVQGINGKYSISYLHEDPRTNAYSFINYLDEYPVRFVYGFEFEGFTYYLTVQKDSVYMEDYVTRLVRVCQKDPAFYSYTEVTLNCRKTDYVSDFYNVAAAAYFGPVGEDLMAKNNWSRGDRALYVTFGRTDDHSDVINPIHGTAVCMFTMSAIKRDFVKAQKDCYTGYGSILPWINKDRKCMFDYNIVRTIDDDFCGNQLNVGIGSRYPLISTATLTTDKRITSVGVVTFNGKTIVIIGTHDGLIKKVLIEGPGNHSPYAVIDVGQGSSKAAVAKDFAFDLLKQHMYVLTNNRVTKVPIESCKVYKNCAECVTTIDPLECGWCGNHCTTQSECLAATWTKDSCPPSIYKFEPSSGPIEGGTRVTIVGHNFGSNELTAENVRVNVEVALVDCVIEYRNGSLVVCRTGRASREMEREIKVSVVDRSKNSEPYIIEGRDSTDHESFFYKKANMLSFKPEVGPRSGGTSLTIQGENLDIGSNLDVHLGHLPCTIISVKSSHIVCNTSRWEAEYNYRMRIKRSDAGTETVNVSIDAANLFVNEKFFRYEEDPEVENVSPRDSILSGGLRITVTGKNLHVIQEPRIVGRVVGDNTVSLPAPCQADASGEMMFCNSPNVNTTGIEVTDEKLLGVDVFFLMDGVETLRQFPKMQPLLSRFTYVMDPIFFKFGGPSNLRTFYDDETHLDIKGAALDQIELKSDIVVMIGDTFCNVTLIGTTILLCSPERPAEVSEDEPLRAVEVIIGNLRFEVGNMQFSKREPNVVVASLLISGLSILLLIVLAFVCILLKKSHKGPFKRKINRTDIPVLYSPGDRVTIGHRSDQQLYRLPTTENPYSSGMHGRLRHRTPLQIPRRPGDSLILDEESRHLIEDANLLIDREKILLLEIIGQGHFGCVYRGLMKNDSNKEDIEVAVKTLKSLTDHNMYTSSHEGRKFLEEALRMREFDHPNIVRLIGIALDKEDMPLVVLPFLKHGDLLTYIRDEQNNPTVKDLMDFGIEIAQGMEYLSNLKFVHRDLAARNCMLDDNMTVKVADFGLSRDIYERDYYSSDDRKAKLPVKWMALESLEKGIYNIKTDVWSFGVVIWELMTRGVCPYPEVDNWDIIKFLKSGRRMPQPSYCPDQLYAIMLQCWEEHARLRPPFVELVKAVKSIIMHMEKAHQRVGLNVTYINVPTTQTYLYPQTSTETDSSGTIYRVMSTTPTGIPAISNVLYSPGTDTGTGVPYYPHHAEAETDGAIGLASGYSSGYDTGSSGMYRTLPDRGMHPHDQMLYHGQHEPLTYPAGISDPLLAISAPHYAHPRGSKATLV